ncbi:MAG TPA: hypothetical protein VLE48_03060 [Terriglobales bacterium]|nr:hypothetical protein [Terriglobales bacterium]
MADEQQAGQPEQAPEESGEQEQDRRGQGTVIGALILAILGAFLSFFAVVLVTLLGLLLTVRDTGDWAAPMGTVIVQVAAPTAFVVFFITLVLMLRRLR